MRVISGAWPANRQVKAEDLVAGSHTLAGVLPPDINCVIGVPRAGLIPATVVSELLHLPLVALSGSLVSMNQGRRSPRISQGQVTHAVIIEDTCATGRSVRQALATCRKLIPKARLSVAAVFARPSNSELLDFAVWAYAGRHFLEYNWANADHGAFAAFDFDGILCEECPQEDDDDGERYRTFLENARPLYLPRRKAIRLVATSRHEKYRDLTMAWLKKWGSRVERLAMRDWEWTSETRARSGEISGAFKAEHFAQSSCALFVESCDFQAEIIARLSHRTVYCPKSGIVRSEHD